MQSASIHSLHLKPLGAGDLIDRAVRFYRKNLWTFVMIAAPPVVVGTMLSVGWTLAGRQLFAVGSGVNMDDGDFYNLFVGFGSIVIYIAESIATLAVMGGASRNFVRHLLFGEPITFRETYRNTGNRLFGLIGASTLITFLLAFLAFFLFYVGLIVTGLIVFLAAAILIGIPIVAVVVSVALGIAGAFLTIWLFFLVASRFAYVPQVMLVEGQGVGSAMARSFSLAGGSVRRLMALFVFSTVATYSALAILYVPVGWYAWGTGVEIMTFGAGIVPAWYEIAYNLIWQVSFILLSPVWTIGLCLLYVDERVRSEGYDIELMAARRLGEIPTVPQAYINPLQPAMSAAPRLYDAQSVPQPAVPRRSHSTLGLD